MAAAQAAVLGLVFAVIPWRRTAIPTFFTVVVGAFLQRVTIALATVFVGLAAMEIPLLSPLMATSAQAASLPHISAINEATDSMTSVSVVMAKERTLAACVLTKEWWDCLAISIMIVAASRAKRLSDESSFPCEIT